MDYYTYIISNQWHDNPARLAELKASGFRCRICNASEADARLEVHHRTYARLGHELVGDLTTLCVDCHCMVTDMLRRRRYGRHSPRFANVTPAIENASPLFDPTRNGAPS